jgi:hypothetical protein
MRILQLTGGRDGETYAATYLPTKFEGWKTFARACAAEKSISLSLKQIQRRGEIQ